MTVNELIEKLRKYSGDMSVVVSFPALNYKCHQIHEVEEWVEIKKGVRAVSINAEAEEIIDE